MTAPQQWPRSRRNFGLWALAAAVVLAGCANVPGAMPEPTTPAAAAAEPSAPAGADANPAGSPALALPAKATAEVAASHAIADASAPRARLDPQHDAERQNLWLRVREGYALPDLDNELVSKWEQWYATRPDYVQRMAERGGRYLFHIVEEVERRGMPSELALLPFIESAFNPQAMSRARASGMWQFMPATGTDFDLRQNMFRDDRRGVLESTRAALDYLQRLHTRFGDWHLTLAAYNWGQGNVQRAIERNRRAGLGTSYSDLVMPEETRNYVPKLLAVAHIVARPAAFALSLPPLQNHPHFLSVTIERDIDVALAARLAGLPLEEFKQLNPQMNKPVILAAGTPQVLLPYDNANRFVRDLPLHRGPLASWTAWVAPRNIKPAEAAHLVGTSEALLREVNFIPPRMLVRSGSTLLVPRRPHTSADVSEHIADTAVMTLAPEPRPTRRVRLKVAKNGESVAAIARRYKVSAAQVAQWNKVSPQAQFKAGQVVVLMVPAASPGPAKRAAKPAPRVRVAQR